MHYIYILHSLHSNCNEIMPFRSSFSIIIKSVKIFQLKTKEIMTQLNAKRFPHLLITILPQSSLAKLNENYLFFKGIHSSIFHFVNTARVKTETERTSETENSLCASARESCARTFSGARGENKSSDLRMANFFQKNFIALIGMICGRLLSV